MTVRKILYVIGQLGVGGAESQLLRLVERLPQQEFSVHVAVLSNSAALKPAFEAAGAQVTVIPKRGLFGLSRLRVLVDLIYRIRPTLIHTILFTGNTWGRIAALLTRTPVIASERSVEIDKTSVHYFIDSILARYSRSVLANSQAVADSITARTRCVSSKVQVVYNGVDVVPFAPMPSEEKDEIARSLGLNLLHPVVGIVANLSPWKDHRTFVSAASLVAQIYPEAQFVAVGDGSERAWLESVGKSVLGDHLFLLGSRRDVHKLVPLFTVGVITSIREGFCNAILEYMAAGVPVVATDVGGNAESVVHGQTGYIVPVTDPVAVAEYINRLLADPRAAQRMGQLGRERARLQFSLEAMAGKMVQLYRSTIY